MYIYMYTYTHIYIFIYIYIHVCIYLYPPPLPLAFLRQLLGRWMPHFRSRLAEKGAAGVEGRGWVPCTPDRL